MRSLVRTAIHIALHRGVLVGRGDSMLGRSTMLLGRSRLVLSGSVGVVDWSASHIVLLIVAGSGHCESKLRGV